MDYNGLSRRLEPQRAYKPLDFGNGVAAGSVAPDGRLLALSSYHPVHGYVTLSGAAPFPDERRHDQAAVRAYRRGLAAPDAPTFGVRFPDASTDREVYLLEDAIPHSRFRVGRLAAQVTTWAPRLQGEAQAAAVQAWSLHNHTDQPVAIEYTWDGSCSLSRASYTQLTESGALGRLSTGLRLAFDGQILSIVAENLPAAAAVLGLPAGSPWERVGDCPLAATARGYLTIPPGQTMRLDLVYALGQTARQAAELANWLAQADPQANLAALIDTCARRCRALDRHVGEPARVLAHRAQAYVLDCCAVPVGAGLCLLTDHQILPLSWTRDAYFALRGIGLGKSDQSRDLLQRHLRWLFETARRPGGYWGRAYLANGHPKDQIFQLDQQCYPLLELAEYAVLSDDETTVAHLIPHVPAVIEAIMARQATDKPLFATEETPADDPLRLPYHFSSHVLLWHTLRQLAALNRRWRFATLDLIDLAEAIRDAVQRFFVAEHQKQALFAYATNLQGAYRFYHDANDLPTVLAPLWGFCEAADPTWQATMEFAFRHDNVGGYYPGPAGGLGSVHTPGPWPLGDVQELLYARLIGDTQRAQGVLARLASTACWDGALPEARDEISGAVRSRHWFAWPGAALLAALVDPAWQPHHDPGRA